MMDVNGGGKAYRYGGEEFTILFPVAVPQTLFRTWKSCARPSPATSLRYEAKNGRRTNHREKDSEAIGVKAPMSQSLSVSELPNVAKT